MEFLSSVHNKLNWLVPSDRTSILRMAGGFAVTVAAIWAAKKCFHPAKHPTLLASAVNSLPKNFQHSNVTPVQNRTDPLMECICQSVFSLANRPSRISGGRLERDEGPSPLLSGNIDRGSSEHYRPVWSRLLDRNNLRDSNKIVFLGPIDETPIQPHIFWLSLDRFNDPVIFDLIDSSDYKNYYDNKSRVDVSGKCIFDELKKHFPEEPNPSQKYKSRKVTLLSEAQYGPIVLSTYQMVTLSLSNKETIISRIHYDNWKGSSISVEHFDQIIESVGEAIALNKTPIILSKDGQDKAIVISIGLHLKKRFKRAIDDRDFQSELKDIWLEVWEEKGAKCLNLSQYKLLCDYFFYLRGKTLPTDHDYHSGWSELNKQLTDYQNLIHGIPFVQPPSDASDFWESLGGYEIPLIIDLIHPDQIRDKTRESAEDKRIQKYYPTDVNKTVRYGSIEVTLIDKDDSQKDYDLHTYQVTDDKGVQSTVLRMHFKNWIKGDSISVENLHKIIQNIYHVKSQGFTPLILCEDGREKTTIAMIGTLLKDRMLSEGEHPLVELGLDVMKRKGKEWFDETQFSLLCAYHDFLKKIIDNEG